MQPRFLGQLGLADLITVTNAAIGFLAVAVAPTDPSLAARLILLAAIADGLDGVVARTLGGTAVGPHLDSLADIASFGVAPAAIVYVVAGSAWPIATATPAAGAALAIPAAFVGMATIRLGFYMLHDQDTRETVGVQTTLAATLIAVAYLAGVTDPVLLLGATAALSYLMIASITYPELYDRDAIVLGGLQALVVAAPTALDRALPRALLLCALAYLLFAPVLYWRRT